MNKSRRIETAKVLLQGGKIATYEQLVKELPYTTMAKQSHISKDRLSHFFYVDMLQMKIVDMHKIAKVLGVDMNVINDLVMEKMARDKKRSSELAKKSKRN